MNDATKNSKESASDLDAIAASLPLFASSVCLACKWHRTIVSGKGSVFMLCQSEETPEHWPKYPPQPKIRCEYFRSSLAP